MIALSSGYFYYYYYYSTFRSSHDSSNKKNVTQPTSNLFIINTSHLVGQFEKKKKDQIPVEEINGLELLTQPVYFITYTHLHE